ncbi:MAG TPA: alpha-L-fucosidase, partial [Candidatus Sulfotelmatobacter sp.]|nr:alpha-L-fucosidase [Candidatus Sulfotelmatobacter sp.]
MNHPSTRRATVGPTVLAGLVAILISAGWPMLAAHGNAAPIPYSTVQVLAEGDSEAVLIEKAAKVLPRPNQTAWMRLERTFFLHFGVNTFNEVEWGSGREAPAIFNPTELDATQWLGAVKHFGGKMIVLVAKHHDGFCMWPTRYTPHSTVASPWRGGQGDLVREVALAAKAQGVQLAVYLSPADLYQLKTNPKNPAGYYGNGSSNVLSVIPTDPASFRSHPAKGRAPTPGFTNYTYVVDDYNRYFLNQLYELLTEYGPIAEVWFDGANPDPSVHETYNYAAWYDLIRQLQPGAVIMGKGPDVRWVGNESGVGRTTEWSVIPLPTAPDKFHWPDMTAGDLGSRGKLKPGSHLWWYPAEVNTTMLQNNQWFWARTKQPRTVTQLVDIFYTSVGRNGNLILNLSPDKRGLVPENQLEALNRAAEILNATFATNLAAGGQVTADSAHLDQRPSFALDGNLDTWWEAAPGKTNGTLTLTLPKPVTFDLVSLQEAVDHRGQRTESFALETGNGTAWAAAERIASDELSTVGHRRLIRLKAP